MAQSVEFPEDNELKFERDDIEEVEGFLKFRFGRGTYIQDITEATTGELIITLGNSVPRNLSDCRNESDRVVKFIGIENIYSMRAEPTNGKYILSVPDRDDVFESFKERKKIIIDQLEYTIAKSIYDKVMNFGMVDNQLTPIRQILYWARENPELEIREIVANQNSSKTREYINVLEDLGFLRVEGNIVSAGEVIDSADLQQMNSKEYMESILGELIQRGYHTLKDEYDFRLLSHYPNFCGAYYFDAIQKDDPELWLDVETIQSNLHEQYNRPYKKLYIEEKLEQLSSVNALTKEGDYVKSDELVYRKISNEVPSL